MVEETHETGSSFSAFLKAAILKSGKSRHELAHLLGYKNPSIVAMFEAGLTRLPLSKVPLLADALGVSRADLMERVLGEYAPHLVAVLEDCSGHAITDNEAEILQFIRRVSGGGDPALASDRQRALLTEAVGPRSARDRNSHSEGWR